jgi:hypothetical protein
MFFNSTPTLYPTLRLAKRRPSGQMRDGVRLGASTGNSQFVRGGRLLFPLLLLLPVFFFIASLNAQDTQSSIEVPDGSSLLLKAKGEGVQVYGCVSGMWQLQAPAAELLDDQGRVIGRHYSGPTWQLKDGSLVKGEVVSKQVSPEATSIPWLLIKSVTGTGRLEAVRFIQRSETHGGVAPNGSCSEATPLRVPYTAIYSFYGIAR